MVIESLHAEEICGFYVNEKMKLVWKTELELLKKFISVCENII